MNEFETPGDSESGLPQSWFVETAPTLIGHINQHLRQSMSSTVPELVHILMQRGYPTHEITDALYDMQEWPHNCEIEENTGRVSFRHQWPFN